jgi:hypothetical protein
VSLEDVREKLRNYFMTVQRFKREGVADSTPITKIVNMVPAILALLDREAEFRADVEAEEAESRALTAEKERDAKSTLADILSEKLERRTVALNEALARVGAAEGACESMSKALGMAQNSRAAVEARAEALQAAWDWLGANLKPMLGADALCISGRDVDLAPAEVRQALSTLSGAEK